MCALCVKLIEQMYRQTQLLFIYKVILTINNINNINNAFILVNANIWQHLMSGLVEIKVTLFHSMLSNELVRIL